MKKRAILSLFLLAALLPAALEAQVYWDAHNLRGSGTLGGDGSTVGITYDDFNHTYMDVYAEGGGIIVNGNVDLRKADAATKSMCVYSSNDTPLTLNGDNYFLNVEVRNGTANDLVNTVIFGTGTSTDIGGTFIIGKDGGGGIAKIDVQQGANISSTGNITLGNSAGKHGVMNIADGASVSTNGQFRVGSDGTGELHLANGSLTSTGVFYVGWHNSGTIYQSSGKITANADTYFADIEAANGIYNMSGNAEFHATQNLSIGQHGRGELNISGGKVTVDGVTNLGNQPKASASGLLKISQADGGTTSVTLKETLVGAATNAHGEIILEGGTLTTNALRVGHAAGATGKVTLAGGTLKVNATSNIGNSGTGEVVHTGGTFDGSNQVIYIADQLNSSGTYTMSGTTEGTIFNATRLVVGQRGNGAFIQNGGAVALTDNLSVGAFNTDGDAVAVGTYDLNGGSVSSNETYIGARGTGTMTVDGGALSTKAVRIGFSDGIANTMVGTLNMKSGEISTTGALRVANSGSSTGTVNHSGGTITVGSEISVGQDANSKGYYYMTGAGAELKTTGDLVIANGANTNGLLEISNGAVSASAVRVGQANGAVATLNMKSGSLTATNTAMRVAQASGSTGTVTHSGGMITVTTETSVGDTNSDGYYYMTGSDAVLRTINFNMARGAGGTGYFEMSDGYLNYDGTADSNTNGNGYFYIGNGGKATAVVSGGEIFGWRIRIAENANSGDSSLKITGGTVKSHGSTTVGQSGKGILIHEGGTLNIGTSLSISNVAEATGSSYSISGTDTVLKVGSDMTVARRGEGTVNQSGGTVTIGNRLHLGSDTATGGTVAPTAVYNLTGGELNSTGIRVYLGNYSDGTLHIDGGTANLTGIHMAPNNANQFTASASIILDSGTLNLGSDGVTKGAGDATIKLGNGTVGSLGAEGHTWANNLNVELTGQTVFDTTDGNIRLESLMSGTGGITKEGVGTLYLTAVNTFTGPLVINEGIVELPSRDVAGKGSISSEAEIFINKNGTLKLSGSIDSLGYHAGNPKMITIDGGLFTTDGGENHHSLGNFTLISGEISGTRSNYNGANHNFIFDGKITVLEDTDGHSKISAQRIMLRTGGLFEVQAGGNLDVSAILYGANTLNMTKLGGGTMTLMAENGLTGHIFVQDGTLALQNPDGGKASIDIGNARDLVVGYTDTAGVAAFHQISGDVGMRSLYLGDAANTNGTYTMDAGTLTTTGNVFVGNNANGTFNLNGGTVTFGAGLYLADVAGSTGAFHVTGGEMSVAGTMAVGQRGPGTFQQDGGTVNANGADGLFIGGQGTATGVGIYNLNGGELNAKKITIRNNGSQLTMTGGGTLHSPEVLGSVHNLGGKLDVAGLSDDSFSTAHITGDYIQGAAGRLDSKLSKTGERAGIMDTVNVDGDLSLDGLLYLWLQNPESWTLEDIGTSIQLFEGYSMGSYPDEVFAMVEWNGDMAPDLMWYYNPMDGTVNLGVPEPATWAMLLLGLLALTGYRRGRK